MRDELIEIDQMTTEVEKKVTELLEVRVEYLISKFGKDKHKLGFEALGIARFMEKICNQYEHIMIRITSRIDGNRVLALEDRLSRAIDQLSRKTAGKRPVVLGEITVKLLRELGEFRVEYQGPTPIDEVILKVYDIAEVIRQLMPLFREDINKLINYVEDHLEWFSDKRVTSRNKAHQINVSKSVKRAMQRMRDLGVDVKLVGSLARGDFEVGSDVDFLVENCPSPLYYELFGEVEKELSDCAFDIVRLEDVSSKYFRDKLVREARLAPDVVGNEN